MKCPFMEPPRFLASQQKGCTPPYKKGFHTVNLTCFTSCLFAVQRLFVVSCPRLRVSLDSTIKTQIISVITKSFSWQMVHQTSKVYRIMNMLFTMLSSGFLGVFLLFFCISTETRLPPSFISSYKFLHLWLCKQVTSALELSPTCCSLLPG